MLDLEHYCPLQIWTVQPSKKWPHAPVAWTAPPLEKPPHFKDLTWGVCQPSASIPKTTEQKTSKPQDTICIYRKKPTNQARGFWHLLGCSDSARSQGKQQPTRVDTGEASSAEKASHPLPALFKGTILWLLPSADKTSPLLGLKHTEYPLWTWKSSRAFSSVYAEDLLEAA